MQLKITILGDLMLDNISSIMDISLEDAIKNKMYESSIDTQVGGTAFSFIHALNKIGSATSTIIGKMGASKDNNLIPDLTGKEIIEKIKSYHSNCLIALDKELPTGNTILISLPGDRRLMLADVGANASFCLEDITPKMEEAVANCNILFISGTCLLYHKRREAVAYLMKLANQNHSYVFVDVVPHSIYNYITYEELIHYTQHANGIIIEKNTAKRFLPSDMQLISSTENSQIAQFLFKNFDLVLLKPNNNIQILYDSDGFYKEEKTNYENLPLNEIRGHSEYSSITLLLEYIRNKTIN